MKKLVLFLVVSFCSLSLHAAGFKGYFGGGYSMATIDIDAALIVPEQGVEGDVEFNLGSLDMAAGMMLNSYLALEGRLGMGVSDDQKRVEISVLEPNVRTTLTRYYGVYLRPQYTQERFQVYGLLGLCGANVEMSIDDAPNYNSGEDSGLSYGLGLGFSPEGSLFFNIEYVNMIDSDDYKFNGVNLRVEFKL